VNVKTRAIDTAEGGQVTVLVVGFGLLCFAIAGLAVDGTRAFLARRTLQNAADGAATAGASQIDTRAYYRSGGRTLTLDEHDAHRAAGRWLGIRGLDASSSVVADARSVSVTLRDEIATSWLGLVGIGEIRVAVVARSRPIAGSP
jgi:Flp pilus assembly protein TadG